MRVRLRPLCESDHEHIVLWRNQSTQYFFSDASISLASHLEWYAQFIASLGQWYFAVESTELLSSPDLLGTISLYDVSNTHRRAEYGRFLIAPEHRRQGYGRDALYLLLDLAFNTLNLNRVYGDILANNHAAIALDERLGFTLEGTFSQHVYKHGKYLDVVRMGITADVWRNRD